MNAPRIYGSEEERFWPKVVKMEGECWIWTACVNEHGYGIFRRSDKTNVRAHRWAYEALIGPIPIGLELDHTCDHPACVNPAHLDPVDHATNVGRALPGRRSDRRLWTHCKHGHEYIDENTYMHHGKRHCRACQKQSSKRQSAKAKEARRIWREAHPR